ATHAVAHRLPGVPGRRKFAACRPQASLLSAADCPRPEPLASLRLRLRHPVSFQYWLALSWLAPRLLPRVPAREPYLSAAFLLAGLAFAVCLEPCRARKGGPHAAALSMLMPPPQPSQPRRLSRTSVSSSEIDWATP